MPRGGKRKGAGAPKGNQNARKHSKQPCRVIERTIKQLVASFVEGAEAIEGLDAVVLVAGGRGVLVAQSQSEEADQWKVKAAEALLRDLRESDRGGGKPERREPRSVWRLRSAM